MKIIIIIIIKETRRINQSIDRSFSVVSPTKMMIMFPISIFFLFPFTSFSGLYISLSLSLSAFRQTAISLIAINQSINQSKNKTYFLPKEASTGRSYRPACALILRIMAFRTFQLQFLRSSDALSLRSWLSTTSFVGLLSKMAQNLVRRLISPILIRIVIPFAAPFWTTAPLRGWAGPNASVLVAKKAAKARELIIFIFFICMCWLRKVGRYMQRVASGIGIEILYALNQKNLVEKRQMI